MDFALDIVKFLITAMPIASSAYGMVFDLKGTIALVWRSAAASAGWSINCC